MGGRARPRAETKAETRAALIDAALAEFGEHGVDTPSLDAICARAGYTRGAFYVHFRDRDDLLVAVVEQALRRFLDAVIASGDDARDLARTVDRFAGAVASFMGVAPRSRRAPAPALPLPPSVPFARILDAVTRKPRLRASFATLVTSAIERLREVTAHAQQARTVRADVEPGQIGTLLVTVALGVLVALDAGMALDPPRLRSTVLRLLAVPSPSPTRRRGGA